jgi:hypothetical protein
MTAWVIDGANSEHAAAMLSSAPEPARLAHRNKRQPAHAA